MPELSKREEEVLKLIIYEYIQQDKPVGSRKLVKKYNPGFSPATLRNIMSDLEIMGFIRQPYTSSGRVPTEKGYKYYVKHLLPMPSLPDKEKFEIKEVFLENKDKELSSILTLTSDFLSQKTNTACIAAGPQFKNLRLRHIEFIALGPKRIMVVIVTENGIMNNKILDLDIKVEQDELYTMRNFINREYKGSVLSELSIIDPSKLYKDRTIFKLRNKISKIVSAASITGNDALLYIHGIDNIIDKVDKDKIKEAIKFFEDQENFKNLLSRSGIDIECLINISALIGNDVDIGKFGEFSFISTNYFWGEKKGKLGVFGPITMDYSKVIAIINYTANVLSLLFNKLVKQ